jgi:ABC-type multidrug transport system fused ATPase/permease subunit
VAFKANRTRSGIGLSGGQRARVALARAVYSRSQILLLDDPLSALDQQTAEFIVRKCFSGEITKDRIVVLVTHRTSQVHHLASQYIEVTEGELNVAKEDPFGSNGIEGQPEQNCKPGIIEEQVQPKHIGDNNKPNKFIEEERKEHGGIKTKVFLAFIQAGKFWWMLLLAAMALSRVASIAQIWFFKAWGEAYHDGSDILWAGYFNPARIQHRNESEPSFATRRVKTTVSWNPIDHLPSPNDDLRPWLTILMLVSLAQAMTLSLYACSEVSAVYATGKSMFEQAMLKVTGASFRFYDITPVGRLMNRLTSDIQVLDSALTYFGSTIFHFSLFVSSVIVIASISPIFLLFSGGLMGLFVLVFQHFLPASRSLKRLESAALSPMYTIFGELLEDQGLAIVRAFHAQPHFYDQTISILDTFQGYGHFYHAVQNWLAFRYELISSSSTFILTAIALVTNLSPGLTGFVLINAGTFVLATHTLCTKLGDLQTEFVSVERLVELLETEQEPEGHVYPPASWPRFGSAITFDNVTVRYAAHMEPSLRDISLHIPGGSTTAVIGRTGSGKSTLASAILNIVRAETGKITIDDISLTDIHVQTLRHRVTFVPQDPVLFLGSIRQNLDPVDEFTDEECEEVLERVCSESSGQAWTLDTHIESGGGNLSQGQRQLIGITRAILRRSPIVILDEATASIDIAKSIELQNILREELKEATLIIIAHRVEAVKDADYLVELENGRVKRYGKVEDESASDNEAEV